MTISELLIAVDRPLRFRVDSAFGSPAAITKVKRMMMVMMMKFQVEKYID